MVEITALIVDDEAFSRKRIRQMLSTEPDFRVVGECSNGEEASAFLSTGIPDVLFVDVQMPRLDGFAVVRSIPMDQRPVVLFVTAYDQYALQAFEAHAFDYLLKPFDRM